MNDVKLNQEPLLSLFYMDTGYFCLLAVSDVQNNISVKNQSPSRMGSFECVYIYTCTSTRVRTSRIILFHTLKYVSNKPYARFAWKYCW